MNIGVIIAHFIVKLYSLHIIVTCRMGYCQGHEYVSHTWHNLSALHTMSTIKE